MADPREFIGRKKPKSRYYPARMFVPRLYSLNRPPELPRESAMAADNPDDQFTTTKRTSQET